MKRKTRKTNSGFTLVEVMVVTLIMSIFSIFLVTLIKTTQTAWSIENTAVPVRGEAKRSIEVIAKELREGDPSAFSGATIGGSGNSQTITFYVPNQVSQSAITSWRKVLFSRDSTNQEISRRMRTDNSAFTYTDSCTQHSTDSCTTVGRNINSLQLSKSNNVVTVTIGTTKTTPEGTVLQTSISSQIRLRN